jgi:hypothetical protein
MTFPHMQICPGGLTGVSRHALFVCIQQGLDGCIMAKKFVIWGIRDTCRLIILGGATREHLTALKNENVHPTCKVVMTS